jgi:hypothetical protein
MVWIRRRGCVGTPSTNEPKCRAERKSTAKVIARARERSAALLPPRKLSKPIAAIANVSAAPEVPFGTPHTAEVQLVNVHQLSYIILRLKVENVPATSMGFGSLHRSRIRSCPRRLCVLERQSARNSRTESSKGLCPDAQMGASRYVR